MADYGGGRATRTLPALRVTVLSQLCGAPLLLACALLLPGALHGPSLAWGAGAGMAGFLGLLLLYRGLASGAMAIVAPITAVTAAIVPLAVGLLLGEVLSTAALVGVGCAVAAIGLVSLAPGSSASPGSGPRSVPAGAAVLGLALGAGAFFGVFFVLLAQSSPDSGLWPLVAGRVVSILVGLTLLRRVAAAASPRLVAGWLVLTGVGEIAANALYLLSTRFGQLAVVAPISSLYPVSTVLLAVALDRERLRPAQVAGLGLAAASLVLTAAA